MDCIVLLVIMILIPLGAMLQRGFPRNGKGTCPKWFGGDNDE